MKELRPVLTLATATALAAFQGGTDDRARFNAKSALISARVVYLTTQSYENVTTDLLSRKNPELRFVDDRPSTGPTVLSVKVQGPRQVSLAVYGVRTCWGIREEGRPAGAGAGVATLYAKRSGPSSGCTATSFGDADFQEPERVWKE